MLCCLPSTKHKVLSSVIRCGSRYHRTSVLVARRPRIRVGQSAIHIASRSRINISSGIHVWSIRVDRSTSIRVRFIGVRVCVAVLVFVLVLWSSRPVLVSVCRSVCVAILAWFVGCNVLRCLAFFSRTANVHGHSLTGFYDLTRSWQLEQDGVGFCLIAGPVRADTKLQISFGKDSLCFESILANYIRNLYFRTTQRQINCGGHSEEKNNRNRNHDGDTSEDRHNSGNYTLQVIEVYNRIYMIYQD